MLTLDNVSSVSTTPFNSFSIDEGKHFHFFFRKLSTKVDDRSSAGKVVNLQLHVIQ